VDAQDCADPIEYWWDFGDGETSAEANPVHTYYDGGYYDWTLTVTSGATVCTTTGGIYVDPFDLSFTDDAGRGRLCANSVTGFFMWFLTAGPYKGYYVWGYAMTSEEPGLLTISSPPWATSWQMIFRYFPEQHRAAGTMYLRGYQLTSAISDRVTTNDPDGCNSIF
jgi:PKD repeat protein